MKAKESRKHARHAILGDHCKNESTVGRLLWDITGLLKNVLEKVMRSHDAANRNGIGKDSGWANVRKAEYLLAWICL